MDKSNEANRDIFQELTPQHVEAVIRSFDDEVMVELLESFKNNPRIEVFRLDPQKVIVRLPFDDCESTVKLLAVAKNSNNYFGLAYEAPEHLMYHNNLTVRGSDGVIISPYKKGSKFRWFKQRMFISAVVDGRHWVAGWKLDIRRTPSLENMMLFSAPINSHDLALVSEWLM